MNGKNARVTAKNLLRMVANGNRVPRSEAIAMLSSIVDDLTPEEDPPEVVERRRAAAQRDAANVPWQQATYRPNRRPEELRGKDFGLQ